MWEAITKANIVWFILPRVFVLISHWARAWRWVLQLRTFGHSISVFTAFNAVMATYLVNIYLSKVGDFYRAWALKKTEQIPVSRSIGTLIIEKFIDLIVLLIFFGIGAYLQYDKVSDFIQNNIWGNLKVKLLHIIPKEYWLPIIIAFAFFLFIALFLWQRGKSSQNSIQIKLKDIFDNIWQGIVSIKNVKNSFGFILLSFVVFAGYWLNFQFSFLAMEETSHLNLVDALFIFTTSAFSQAAPIQGGIGAFHWMVSEALSILKITPEIAIAWATAMHAFGILFRIVTGIFGVLYLRTKGVQISDIKENSEQVLDQQ